MPPAVPSVRTPQPIAGALHSTASPASTRADPGTGPAPPAYDTPPTPVLNAFKYAGRNVPEPVPPPTPGRLPFGLRSASGRTGTVGGGP
ncbi:hypothetical protein GCM10009759_15640 [Kitasatospora saccharophila]|uniref:Uncharacterized protein n=1 Tax=Kitasatospora saccharophila TaxID=407973 RepID=A0ABN2WFD5_9ACTN